jgi:hypothetical protein
MFNNVCTDALYNAFIGCGRDYAAESNQPLPEASDMPPSHYDDVYGLLTETSLPVLVQALHDKLRDNGYDIVKK